MANKIYYNGREIVDIDSIKDKYTKTETDALLNTKYSKTEVDNLIADKVESNDVTKIEVVTDYPQQEEAGTLYIKVENE